MFVPWVVRGPKPVQKASSKKRGGWVPSAILPFVDMNHETDVGLHGWVSTPRYSRSYQGTLSREGFVFQVYCILSQFLFFCCYFPPLSFRYRGESARDRSAGSPVSKYVGFFVSDVNREMDVGLHGWGPPPGTASHCTKVHDRLVKI